MCWCSVCLVVVECWWVVCVGFGVEGCLCMLWEFVGSSVVFVLG